MTTTAIWWIRRDLRLTDNHALTAALTHAQQIIPLFILDPALLNSPYSSQKRQAFLYGGLHQLDKALRARGSRLIVRQAEQPLTPELSKIIAETKAHTIYAEEDFSPYAKKRDRHITANLPLRLTNGLTVRHPHTVLKKDGDPYRVFTPYSRSWREFPLPTMETLLPAPETINTPPNLPSDPLPASPTLPESVPFLPGEAEAHRRLEQFINHSLADYEEQRNRMDLTATSQLSPYLRFGMLSSRQAVVAAQHAPAKAESWLNELIWRDFYIAILHHFPHVRQGNFRQQYDTLAWRNDKAEFAAWCEGRTGYPVIDAAMRQLNHSGWMHNRARMLVASFLVKHLLIDWQWGERYFMQHLIDGDPAANNGGWQWSAGTGTDAAPYFRIFNPLSQSKKFDPHGDYIRRWVPELRAVPDKHLHTPWQMDTATQRQANCHIGTDYPAPLVNHAEARERALAAYKQAKS